VVGIAASVMLWYVYKMVREGRESTVSQQAAAKGWQAEAMGEGGDRVMRYRGAPTAWPGRQRLAARRISVGTRDRSGHAGRPPPVAPPPRC
jgi:hypothetical protein